MYYSINIGDKNTFDDWHLLSTSRQCVAPPIPKTNYIEVPGKSGMLDYTNALVKTPRYSDREGTWEFIVLNPGDIETYQLKDIYPQNHTDLYSELMQYFDGRVFDKIWLEDDPDYYYTGRVWLSNYQNSSSWSQVTLSYHLEPFKRKFIPSSKHYVHINSEIIRIGEGVEVNIELPKGTLPAQLYLRFTTSAEYSAIHISFENLEIQSYMSGVSVSTGMDFSPSDYDKDLAFSRLVVSNISGNNVPRLYFGPPDDVDPSFYDVGPLTIEYWWDEVRL